MNNTHQQPHTADAGAAQAASSPAEGSAAGDQGLPAYQQIKLALDVHAATIVAVRMLDGAKPQPPQTMKPADFLAWVQKQKAQARARKRAIVAFARQLFVDLWRWKTGRRTPAQLGWVMTTA